MNVVNCNDVPEGLNLLLKMSVYFSIFRGKKKIYLLIYKINYEINPNYCLSY